MLILDSMKIADNWDFGVYIEQHYLGPGHFVRDRPLPPVKYITNASKKIKICFVHCYNIFTTSNGRRVIALPLISLLGNNTPCSMLPWYCQNIIGYTKHTFIFLIAFLIYLTQRGGGVGDVKTPVHILPSVEHHSRTITPVTMHPLLVRYRWIKLRCGGQNNYIMT